MKNLINCLILLFAFSSLEAQSLSPEVVATAGDTYSSSTVQLDWTLGELMTETIAGTIVLTQGFHQGNLILTSVEDLAGNIGTIKVYPNPTTGSISVDKETIGEIQLVIMDMKGSIVLQENLSASFSEIDLSQLPGGLYVLRLSDGKQAARSIRIKKL